MSNAKAANVLEVIASLKRTAGELAASGEGIRQSTETIVRASNTWGTKGAAHHDLLIEKVEKLKNLHALRRTSAVRLAEYAERLSGDHPEDEALAELLGVAQFLVDQIRSEQRDVRRILSLLQQGRSKAESSAA